MEQKHIRSWTGVLFFSAWMMILAFLSPVVPVLPVAGSLILVFYLPVLSIQYDLRLTLLLAVLSVAVLAFFAGPVPALVQWGAAALMGWLAGAGYSRHVSPLRILLGESGILIGLGILICLAAVISQIHLFDLVQQTVSQITDEAAAYYLQNNPGSPQIIEIHQQMKTIKEMVPLLLPVQACLSVLIVAYLQLRGTQFILARQGFSVPAFMPVRLWEMPRLMIYVYVVAMVMKYWGMSRSIFWLNMLAVNLDQFASFFICMQGVAFALYLLHHRFVLRSSTQALIILIVLFVPLAQIAAFFLGLGDMLFNYRKKKEAL